jgi:hypothetical protein
VTTNKDDRTFGELFAELSRESRTLVQQQIQLAKSEVTEKTTQLGKRVGLIVGGGFVAYGGLLAIMAAVVLALIALGVPVWVGVVAGGIVVAGAGYLPIRSGLAGLHLEELTPRQTIETLKEDGQWLKSHAK